MELNCGFLGRSSDLSHTNVLYSGLGVQPVSATDFLGHLLGIAEFGAGHRDGSYCSSLSHAPVSSEVAGGHG